MAPRVFNIRSFAPPQPEVPFQLIRFGEAAQIPQTGANPELENQIGTAPIGPGQIGASQLPTDQAQLIQQQAQLPVADTGANPVFFPGEQESLNIAPINQGAVSDPGFQFSAVPESGQQRIVPNQEFLDVAVRPFEDIAAQVEQEAELAGLGGFFLGADRQIQQSNFKAQRLQQLIDQNEANRLAALNAPTGGNIGLPEVTQGGRFGVPFLPGREPIERLSPLDPRVAIAQAGALERAKETPAQERKLFAEAKAAEQKAETSRIDAIKKGFEADDARVQLQSRLGAFEVLEEVFDLSDANPGVPISKLGINKAKLALLDTYFKNSEFSTDRVALMQQRIDAAQDINGLLAVGETIAGFREKMSEDDKIKLDQFLLNALARFNPDIGKIKLKKGEGAMDAIQRVLPFGDPDPDVTIDNDTQRKKNSILERHGFSR